MNATILPLLVVACLGLPDMLLAQSPRRSAPDTTQASVYMVGTYAGDRNNVAQSVRYQRGSPGSPTVVFIHGGGLTNGDRDDEPAIAMCDNLSKAGVACASVNYRLVRQAPWPAQPQDVAAAIAWVIDQGTKWRADPKRVFLLGHSSGCHLAAVVATDTTYLAAHKLSPRDLGGVIAMGCLLRQIPPAIADTAELRRFFSSGRWIFPSLEAFRDADPTLHVGPHTPPTLVLVAESEQQQPPILENAQLFAERMRAAGRPVEVSMLPGRTHMSAVEMMRDPLDPTYLQIVEFITRTKR